MRLTRRGFLILVGLSALDVVLETQGYGAISLISKTASRIIGNSVKIVARDDFSDLIDRVCEFFHPDLRPYLKTVRIGTSSAARTAYSHSRDENQPLIVVSPDFFNTAAESVYWRDYYSKPPYSMEAGQPVFSEAFRLQLLTHEMMHIAQAKTRIEPGRFYKQVERWYPDESMGRPVRGGGANYTKFVLWWNIYGCPGRPDVENDGDWKRMEYCERYAGSEPGVEEFAYVGETLLVPADVANRAARLRDITPDMRQYYAGVVAPDILA